MTDSRNLRILYTINANPQYILARTLRPVEVTILSDAPAGPSTPQARYATALLKPTLDAVCRSSPELVQDRSRDFSVYLLDPLESNFAASNSRAGIDRGVAVGLGLLSTVDEIADTPVTGTLVRLPTGQEAVEIILSFTETRACRPQPSPIPPSAPAPQTPTVEATPSPAPDASQNLRNSSTLTRAVSLPASSSTAPTSAEANKGPPNWSLVNPSKVKKKPSKANAPRADLIYANTQTYIGPQIKKGRPRRTPTAATLFNQAPDAPEMQMAGPSPSFWSTASSAANAPMPAPATVLAPTPASASGPGAPNNSEASPSAPSASADAKHNLLDVLALIMTCSGDPAQQAALLASLSTIDSSSPQQTAAILEQVRAVLVRGRAAAIAAQPDEQQRRPSDDDVVLLDKENCNPSPPKPSGKDLPPTPSTSAAPTPSESRSGLQNSTSKSNATPKVVPPAAPASGGNATAGRKRTFDQFAAGITARAGSSKESRRQSSGENRVPATSPVRPPRQSSSSNASSSKGESANRTASASSPVRPPNRRPYTVPSWARTGTATQPRLSEEAKRLQHEASLRRRDSRLARKRERRLIRQGLDTEEESYSDGTDRGSASSSAQSRPKAESKPQASSGALPLFPTGSFPVDPITSSADLPPPSTPPRRRAGSLPATPDGFGGSLFTPSTPRGLRAPVTPVTPKRPRPSPSRTPRSRSVGADGADAPAADWDDDDDDFLSRELAESPSAGRSSDARRPVEAGYVPPSSPLPPSSPPRSSPLDYPMELEEVAETVLSPEPLVGTPGSAEGLSGTPDAFDMLQLFIDSAPSSDAPFDGGSAGDTLGIDTSGIDTSMFDNGLVEMDFTEFWQSIAPTLQTAGPWAEDGGPLLENSTADSAAQDSPATWDGTNMLSEGDQGEGPDVHSLFSGCLL
ncbi:hypothetical protein HDZ31DRAFT_34776 [Schizophyllum fasciatum]